MSDSISPEVTLAKQALDIITKGTPNRICHKKWERKLIKLLEAAAYPIVIIDGRKAHQEVTVTYQDQLQFEYDTASLGDQV